MIEKEQSGGDAVEPDRALAGSVLAAVPACGLLAAGAGVPPGRGTGRAGSAARTRRRRAGFLRVRGYPPVEGRSDEDVSRRRTSC